MGIWDILLLLLVAAAVTGALLSIRRSRKRGRGCCGNCAACMAGKKPSPETAGGNDRAGDCRRTADRGGTE